VVRHAGTSSPPPLYEPTDASQHGEPEGIQYEFVAGEVEALVKQWLMRGATHEESPIVFDGDQDGADQEHDESIKEEAMGNAGSASAALQGALSHHVGYETGDAGAPIEWPVGLATESPQACSTMQAVAKTGNRGGRQQVEKELGKSPDISHDFAC